MGKQRGNPHLAPAPHPTPGQSWVHQQWAETVQSGMPQVPSPCPEKGHEGAKLRISLHLFHLPLVSSNLRATGEN